MEGQLCLGGSRIRDTKVPRVLVLALPSQELHFFLFFSLLPFPRLPSPAFLALKVIVVNRYMIPKEKLTTFFFQFQFQNLQGRTGQAVGQNFANIHQPIGPEDDCYRNHVIAGQQEDAFYRNQMDEVELEGGRENEQIAPSGQCPRASFFSGNSFFSHCLSLLKLCVFQSLGKCYLFHNICQSLTLDHESSKAETRRGCPALASSPKQASGTRPAPELPAGSVHPGLTSPSPAPEGLTLGGFLDRTCHLPASTEDIHKNAFLPLQSAASLQTGHLAHSRQYSFVNIISHSYPLF